MHGWETSRRWPPVPLDEVDLDTLGMLLHGSDFGGGYFDPGTGDVIQSFDGEVLGADGEPVDVEETDWIPVDGLGARHSYQDMADFAEAVADPVAAERLTRALEGRGAFRRFRDTIHDQPEALRSAWFRFRDARQQGCAVDWLAEAELVDEAAAKAAADERAEAAGQVLEELAGTVGPRCEADGLVERWGDLQQVIDEGSPVLLTRGGQPWAVIHPLR